MNELNKPYLQNLANDDKALEALKEELLTSLDNKKPNLELNNENLGAETRAAARAKELVEEGLKNIKKLKVNNSKVVSEANPGR